MASLFLTFRYIAFAFFIIFSSVICIVSAVNLGALLPNTQSFPQIDVFLICTGALALALIFPVIFTELVRRNAFISRVIVEVSWLAILWLMNIAGAAGLTALSGEIHCSPDGNQPQAACSSSLALLTFSWLNTIAMLAYLLCLVISAVYHAQDNNSVWHTGVRDFQWFTTQNKTPQTPLTREHSLTYGRLVAPPKSVLPSRLTLPPIYAQQMGLTKDYQIEPLRVPPFPQIATPPNDDLAHPPAPVAAYLNRVASYNSRMNPGGIGSTPTAFPTQTVLSLYPGHLQSTTAPVNPPKIDSESSPPAGHWPRKNPQEPLRPKHSRRKPRTYSRDDTAVAANPDTGEDQNWTERPRPTGPRTSLPRPRPPPIDFASIQSRQHRQT